MKSDLKKLALSWAIITAVGFIIWFLLINSFIQPILENPDMPERNEIRNYAYITYFQGAFSVEIRGTIGRNSINQTRTSGFIILSLIPIYFGIKKPKAVKTLLMILIPLLWSIHPFINLYLWNNGH